jgi:hypothetical protein
MAAYDDNNDSLNPVFFFRAPWNFPERFIQASDKRYKRETLIHCDIWEAQGNKYIASAILLALQPDCTDCRNLSPDKRENCQDARSQQTTQGKMEQTRMC